MFNRLKMWAYVAAIFGGAALLGGGCGWQINRQMGTILAILQEDAFG
jgi:hypothetical protein